MKYNSKLIDFFKLHNTYNEKMFNYLESRTILIDYNNEEEKPFIGCYHSIDNKTKKLKNFTIIIPYVIDDKTMLINIHEIVHGIIAYKFLNRKYNIGLECEALSLMYERVFVIENENKELSAYKDYLDSMIESSSDDKYKYGVFFTNYIIDKGINDFNKLHRTSKRLVKKYKNSQQ